MEHYPQLFLPTFVTKPRKFIVHDNKPKSVVNCTKERRKFTVSDRPPTSNEVLVHTVQIFPRPDDAPDPFNTWTTTLNNFGDFVLGNDFNAARFEERLRTLLSLHLNEITLYKHAIVFLGNYLALGVMMINSAGPPETVWFGPMTHVKKYPLTQANLIWEKIKESGKAEIVKNVLKTVCPKWEKNSKHEGHPFFVVDKYNQRVGIHPFVDTMGNILDMVISNTGSAKLNRQLLIATRGNVFMGHLFLTMAHQEKNGIKGLMLYGVCRSPYHLPDTCVDVDQAVGFIAALFDRIDTLIKENRITHAFTWPLEKMKARFLTMGWKLIRKGDVDDPNYNTLCESIESIYGVNSKISNVIMGSQFVSFDFVLRTVDHALVNLIRRCVKV